MTPAGTQRIVVMGVSGCGKSTVGAALAAELGLAFVDADDLHPLENREKMAAGVPLEDDDRWPWLARVGEALAAASAPGIVVACSALRFAYREAIRSHAPDVLFVHLDAPRDALAARLAARTGHFMPPALLDSQLATLEPLGESEAGFAVEVAADAHDGAGSGGRADAGEIARAIAGRLTH